MLLFLLVVHSTAAHAEIPDFLLPAPPLPSFLFPLTATPSLSAKAMDASRPQLSTEALWPQFNHHAKPNSSSCFYFSGARGPKVGEQDREKLVLYEQALFIQLAGL